MNEYTLIGIGIVIGIVLTLVGGIGWAVWMWRQQYRVVDDYRKMIERHERNRGLANAEVVELYRPGVRSIKR